MMVQGTFEMGSPSCPIQSGIEIIVPGGVESNGIDVLDSGKFDVHGFTQVNVVLLASPVAAAVLMANMLADVHYHSCLKHAGAG